MATITPPRRTEKSATKKPMSATHKASLAKGREEGRLIRHYLEALELAKPKRGRKRTPKSIEQRIKTIDAQVAEAAPLARVQLVQERMDLEAELSASAEASDLPALEAGFVKVAKGYGDRKGISYAAWRSVGVSANVLQKAGVSRSRG